ncbi:uncharacterized protein LOC128812348 [Vidua macroura]|uniref:uncharacterized protein LOC128812348 n=1 Tax=Vidua macroura TaxID=187451 RepID=UPI0023A8FA99|nr:uncharacterized protein LOC128812348 [Vidua macroura]
MVPWQCWVLGWDGTAGAGEQLQAELGVWSLPSLSPSRFPSFPFGGQRERGIPASSSEGEGCLCAQASPLHCTGWDDGHAQENSPGWELLAARSIPGPVSIAEGSVSSEHSPGTAGNTSWQELQPGGSAGRAAHAGSEPLPRIQADTAGQEWFAGLPGSFQDRSRIIPCPSRPIPTSPLAAAAARTGSAPSAPSPLSLAGLSWPEPSMPTISAQPEGFCFDGFKKGASAASCLKRKDWRRKTRSRVDVFPTLLAL